jgi:hypothetical protein
MIAYRQPRTLSELRALPFIGEVTRKGNDYDAISADLDLRWLPSDWLNGDTGSIIYAGTVRELLQILKHEVWPYLREPTA